MITVTCGNCGGRLKAKDEHADRTAKCPKCGATMEVPKPSAPDAARRMSLATERQKEYATTLGIDFHPDITRRELSDLIDAAVTKRDDERFARCTELSNRESEATEAIRRELLAGLDADDCRLSTAQPSQMVEELERREVGAVLITFDIENVDFQNPTGTGFNIAFSENMSEDEMRIVLQWLGITMLNRSK